MYYLIEISTGDSKIAGKSIYTYADYNDAIGTFHTKLGNAMKSDLFTSELVMVIDDYGTVLKVERYDKPMPEVIDEISDESVVEE